LEDEKAGKEASLGGPLKEDDFSIRLEKCIFFQEEIVKVSPKAALETSRFLPELSNTIDPGRLELVYDSLRAVLSREISASIRQKALREELGIFLASPPSGDDSAVFLELLQKTLSKETILPEEVEPLRTMYHRLLSRTEAQKEGLEVLKKVSKFLKGKGYRVLDGEGLAYGKAAFLEGLSPDYRLELKLDKKGGISLRQLKVAASKEEALLPLSDYQRALDKKAGESLCGTLKELMAVLAKDGVGREMTILSEPGSALLPVMVDPSRKVLQKVGADQKPTRSLPGEE
jgi:hypothetical protein